MTVSQVPDTSTTLLRDVADSQHARWAVFHSRYEPMMRSFMSERFPSLDADDIIQETFIALAKALPKAYRVSGDPESGWIVSDYIDVVVHVFSAEARAYYALEKLWA